MERMQINVESEIKMGWNKIFCAVVYTRNAVERTSPQSANIYYRNDDENNRKDNRFSFDIIK